MNDCEQRLTDLLNELLENAPIEWDDDVAAESIAIEYVRHLEAEVKRLGGNLHPNLRSEEEATA